MAKYIVQLNEKYITEYSFRTGYMEFCDNKADALRFDTVDDVTDALVDIVWGEADRPPEVVEVEE